MMLPHKAKMSLSSGAHQIELLHILTELFADKPICGNDILLKLNRSSITKTLFCYIIKQKLC